MAAMAALETFFINSNVPFGFVVGFVEIDLIDVTAQHSFLFISLRRAFSARNLSSSGRWFQSSIVKPPSLWFSSQLWFLHLTNKVFGNPPGNGPHGFSPQNGQGFNVGWSVGVI